MNKNILHVETIDLDNERAGGVESLIRDLIDYDPTNSGLIGVRFQIKEPKVREASSFEDLKTGKVDWASIARLRDERGVIPDSLRLAWGLVRNRKHLNAHSTYIVHRVEIGLIMRTLGLKYILFLHNDSQGLLGENSESRWKKIKLLFRVIRRFSIKGAKSVFVFNPREFENARLLAENVYQISSWFDDQIFKPDSRKIEHEKADLKIAWVGRFESQKNPAFAIEIADTLKKKGVQFHMCLVGKGTLIEKLKDILGEKELTANVSIVGDADRKKVAKIMKESDCLLMTSFSEGSPIVAVEGGAVGLPCVTSSEADPDLWIVDGVNGFRVPNFNLEVFCESLIKSKELDKNRIIEIATNRSKAKLVPNLYKLLLEN